MMVKFIYSEKATKFDEIALFFWHYLLPGDVKKRGQFRQIFVAYLENLNIRFSTSLVGIFQMRVEFFKSSERIPLC